MLQSVCFFYCSRFKITSRYEDDQSSDGQSGGQTPGAERGGAISAQMQQHQQYLGDIAAGMPELPDVEIDEQQGMSGVFSVFPSRVYQKRDSNRFNLSMISYLTVFQISLDTACKIVK